MSKFLIVALFIFASVCMAFADMYGGYAGRGSSGFGRTFSGGFGSNPNTYLGGSPSTYPGGYSGRDGAYGNRGVSGFTGPVRADYGPSRLGGAYAQPGFAQGPYPQGGYGRGYSGRPGAYGSF